MIESKKFRAKPKEVDALECSRILAAAANGSASLLPRWVQDAIFSKRLEISPTAYAVVAYPLPMVPRMGAARDWILHDPSDDSINIVPPETLEALYDVVDN